MWISEFEDKKSSNYEGRLNSNEWKCTTNIIPKYRNSVKPKPTTPPPSSDHLPSISSTFYVFVFLYKMLLPKITKLFEIFWHQNIGAKCARKMLMKLTPSYSINYSGDPILHVYALKLPMNNDNLSTKITVLWLRGWSLYTICYIEKNNLQHFS